MEISSSPAANAQNVVQQQLQTEQQAQTVKQEQQQLQSQPETSVQQSNAGNSADPDARLGTQIDVTV